jgi:hypothetical protein
MSKFRKGGDLMAWEIIKDPEEAMRIMRSEEPYAGPLAAVEDEVMVALSKVLKANRDGLITRDVENTLVFLLPEPVDKETLWEIIREMIVERSLFVLTNDQDQFLVYVLLDGDLWDDGSSEDSDI